MTDTAKPSETSPQPVPDHPGWAWWRGVAGLLYARIPGSTPPIVVRAHNFPALLARIRATGVPDVADLQAEFPSWEIGTVERSEVPPGRNLTARRDGVLLADATAAGLREKIRREEGSC